jgi:UDP-N-acetylglucosamine 4,6-dehydratase
MHSPASPAPFADLAGQSILVTGATGSFGRQFVRTALERCRLRRLIVFSRDEAKQHQMALELSGKAEPSFDHLGMPVRFFIGDVRDAERLEMAMREVDVVVHAAALKHVPLAEYNPFECIRTNVHGAENVVRAALRCGVKKVIALSTDKAANPVNLYGASKLASDKIFVAANNLSGSIGTRFSVVRYGNVVGSRGSIVDVFRRLIAMGADRLPITDVRMTRFWITLQQGVDFVLACLERMQGGEIFVPKIPSMRIVDLATAMAPNLPHHVIGIRPGEKLHEVMVTDDDARNTLELPDHYLIQPGFAFWNGNHRDLASARPLPNSFRYASDTNDKWLDVAAFRRLLAEAPA